MLFVGANIMSTVTLIQSHPFRKCPISDVSIGDSGQLAHALLNRAHKIFHRKNTLFLTGDEFTGVYIVRSGPAKSFISSKDGIEHITKFHFAGELIGLDGFSSSTHNQTIEFLETSSVCFISVAEINESLKNTDNFCQNLLKAISCELITGSAMSMSYSIYTSEQRIAKFLLDLSTNFVNRGQSGYEFLLSMTRTDIANYLGMAIETVSRVLGKFQKYGVIDVHHRVVKINEIEMLTNCLYCVDCLNVSLINNHNFNHNRALG